MESTRTRADHSDTYARVRLIESYAPELSDVSIVTPCAVPLLDRRPRVADPSNALVDMRRCRRCLGPSEHMAFPE